MQLISKYLNRINYPIYFIILFLLKSIIFYIDRLPMFFLGDSHSYITTSLTGWIPLDRSFLYGFFIRLVSVSSSSLTSLIAAQVCAGLITSFLIAYSLIKFFSVNRKLSFLFGLLCAIEPLQLLYERYVMTETISLLIFSFYLVTIFYYIKRQSSLLIILVQILGTLLISFRMSFLPLVLANCIILPFLAFPVLTNNNPSKKIGNNNFFKLPYDSFQVIGIIFIHLILSLGSAYLLHNGYKNLNGLLSKKPPAYQYQGGIFLLSNWSPIVKPIDFSRSELTPLVFANLKFDLHDRHNRDSQHWRPGGIIDNLNKAIPDNLEADSIAKATAMNALRRDPFALVLLSIKTFGDYFNLDWLQGSMKNDSGNRSLPEGLLDVLRNNFNLSAEQLPFTRTFTKYYYFKCWPWYLFLLFLPVLCIVNLFLCSASVNKYVLVLLLVSVEIVAVAVALVEGPTVRYLHPAAWLAFWVLGSFFSSMFNLKDK